MAINLDKISVVDLLIRHSLIDCALLLKNKEMFYNLQSENWKEYIYMEEEKEGYVEPEFKNVDWKNWYLAIKCINHMVKNGLADRFDYEAVQEVYYQYLDMDKYEFGKECDENLPF